MTTANPVTLTGRKLRLEPLEERHLALLWNNLDPTLFKYMYSWWWGNTFEDFCDAAHARMSSSAQICFSMVLQDTGEPVGSSSYIDLRPEHRSLEIGSTWIVRAHQATFVNPEAKFLMLTHAFENLDCIRVQLKTDRRNLQSQAAMEKLGCVKEGVLRNHILCSDGYIRDSVMYSVIAQEWPALKERLIERLGYDPGRPAFG